MGWCVSVFLDTVSCEQALSMALHYAVPEIINSDQGCQFTSESWCNMLTAHNIKISMDGKGRWSDNVYVERLWRSIKYELVYLHRFETVSDVRKTIADYIEFYNTQRPHQSLGYNTSDRVYREFEQKTYAEKIVDVAGPLFGVNYNSQISCGKLS